MTSIRLNPALYIVLVSFWFTVIDAWNGVVSSSSLFSSSKTSSQWNNPPPLRCFTLTPPSSSFGRIGMSRTFRRETSLLLYAKRRSSSNDDDTVLDNDNSNDNNDNNVVDGMYSQLLDDGRGNIRADLATSIYKWENDIRQEQHLPRVQYSTRAGLRLVKAMIDTVLLDVGEGTNKSTFTPTSAATSSSQPRPVTAYSDLVQEGVVALMCAMASYNDDQQQQEQQQSFEDYAKQTILTSLQKVLAQEYSRPLPIRVPPNVVEVLQLAKRKRQELSQSTGREPTMALVVQQLLQEQQDDNNTTSSLLENITVHELEFYQLLTSDFSTFSVERTMELYDPTLEQSATFADQTTFEQRHYGIPIIGMNTDDDSRDTIQQLVQEDDVQAVDRESNQEGNDEMYRNLEMVVAPLSEMIVDDDDCDNPGAVLESNELHNNVLSLLSAATLSSQELHVICMRFGLDATEVEGTAATTTNATTTVVDTAATAPTTSSGSSKGGTNATLLSSELLSSSAMSVEEIATALGMTTTDVRRVERQAMEKLRSAVSRISSSSSTG